METEKFFFIACHCSIFFSLSGLGHITIHANVAMFPRETNDCTTCHAELLKFWFTT